MPSLEFRKALFRARDTADGNRVLPIELFFDLVFVFAVTQLSHRLVAHLTPLGALETLILFAAVWWLWIFTSWATNWLDPERGLVRFMLMAMMLGGIILSVAIPKAFEEMALLFAATYVVMQLGRTLLIVWASRGHNTPRVRNFLRMVFYFVISAPLWIAGALIGGEARLALWAGAVVIEYAGPWLFFRTPGLGKSRSEDWDISGAHMAERCALFIIIALGETILIIGATFAKLTPDLPTTLAFASSFLSSAIMWWIYFDTGAKRGGEAIEDEATDTGRIARNAYTYLHMPIVAGIIVTAVADEKLLAHPSGHADLPFVLVACGGPILFLLGNQAFKWVTGKYPIPPLSHTIGMVLLVAIGIGGLLAHWQPVTIGLLASGALLITASWEWFSLNGGWRRWTPWLDRDTAIALEKSER